ncbi:transport system permease protein [Beutenbergia cavernae DSM 12333]|uniref:Transport system permease protein n=1 Tax=Beutenbergia cavernae (strain ATCC BAA-8 / DSM 12333 / CCUG 43141 / JCM 11478 / NBRC 16432 / NCIMB 13614 / HKI 0122) TaxID=471853 RepID=C5BVG7_BEUC1|nr:iron chelate uptake ABC transporter family permease subunit [Beutenbergia cavernae]ACQ78407.1 transport system permease protein [Beutenbergia cavernae DSM 12333]
MTADVATTPRPPRQAPLSRSAGAVRRFGLLVAASLAVIAVGTLLGLAIGSHQVGLRTVVEALVAYDPGVDDHRIVVLSRLPRTVLALVVGLALGMAGTLMQSVTRNPLADPGLLGINAGASAAVVVAIAYLGVTTVQGYVWFAFAGAAAAAVVVYAIGSAHRSAATPVRMALAGAAVSVAVAAVTNAVLLSDERAFNSFRYWAVGSLQGRGLDVTTAVLPFVVVGLAIALLLARPLNAVALGDDVSRAVGATPGLARLGSALAVVLLAGAATAAAGPIGFVGLAAPHIVRGVVGPDHRLLLPGVLVVAPAFLLLADVLGRVAVAPGELQTGIAVAILGGPLFVALVRSRRVAAL